MRFDSVGMFWQDAERTRGRSGRPRVMPPIPDTGWLPPRVYPNLSAAKVLSIDTETYDPDLEDHGPGWARNKGHICGFSVGTDDGYRWYFPIRHEIEKEHNLDPNHALAWLRDTLGNRNQPKVGANLIYDYGWLLHEGIKIAGDLYDVQFAEALLDDRARVGLDTLGQKYLKEGKTGEILYKWLADYYGGKNDSSQRGNIYRAPPRLVGPYGEGDADLPIRLMPVLAERLRKQRLYDLFRMECDLIPLLVKMRFAGVSVDIKKADELRERLQIKSTEEYKRLAKLVGFDVNINSGNSLAKAFDSIGLKYHRTAPTKRLPQGNPSFTKQFLESINHPVVDHIREIRRCDKLRGTFVEGYVLGGAINGKVHCSFHPLRGDEGGTVTGRFSSSNPNLQNIPVRDPELGKLIRGLFRPDEGHRRWIKYDYSQVEYRLLIHYAIGPGSDAARLLFNTHPDTDYHLWTQKLVEKEIGRELDRRPIKNLNFGLIYGMGEEKLQASLNLKTKAEALHFLNVYHKGVPFARPTMDAARKEAESVGFITTILGRRRRFDLWGPRRFREDQIPVSYEKAIEYYGYDIIRAYGHKALNARLQGSAADLIKIAMWKCFRDGVFDYVGVPRLTVHDELDFSDPGGVDDGFEYISHVMESAIKLRIPIKVDREYGPDWGSTEKPQQSQQSTTPPSYEITT